MRVAALCCASGFISVVAHAQRGCSWYADDYRAADHASYWTNPRMRNVPYDGRLIIARIWYSGYFAYCAASAPYSNELSVGWAHDYPHPEENVAQMMNALSTVRMYVGGNILRFDDPEIVRFPIAYLTEPGGWVPSEREVLGARNYLLKGGFLIIDDWRGPDASMKAWACSNASSRRSRQ